MKRPDSGVPSASLVYRLAAGIALNTIRAQRWQLDVTGLEHVPTRGGAVIAMNHTSFWDFFTSGRAPYDGYGRPIRILAKASLFDTPIFGWLMRKAEHIPVHRGAGGGALRSAIAALEAGELVLVLPEQTISRSFELLAFKSGAARMAQAAGVPLIPTISWGSHRFHTAGRLPRWRWRLPVTVTYGEPLRPSATDDPDEVTAELRQRMRGLLDDAVRCYPDGTPAGAWWVPERFGGGARHHDLAEADAERLAERWRDRRSGTA